MTSFNKVLILLFPFVPDKIFQELFLFQSSLLVDSKTKAVWSQSQTPGAFCQFCCPETSEASGLSSAHMADYRNCATQSRWGVLSVSTILYTISFPSRLKSIIFQDRPVTSVIHISISRPHNGHNHNTRLSTLMSSLSWSAHFDITSSQRCELSYPGSLRSQRFDFALAAGRMPTEAASEHQSHPSAFTGNRTSVLIITETYVCWEFSVH